MKIRYLEYVFSTFLARESIKGEKWHPYYKKDKKTFAKIVESIVLTEREVYSGFVEMFRGMDMLIRWNKYNLRLAKKFTGSASRLLTPSSSYSWRNITDKLFNGLIVGLVGAIEAGGERVEIDTNLHIGWSRHEPVVQEFLREYSFDLVKGLNYTTRKRLASALKSGIERGLTQDLMGKELAKIFKDRHRSSMIANTEVVRAYNEGRRVAMRNTGLYYEWKWLDGQPDSCPICQGLHETTRKVGETFDGGYQIPPDPHPYCRCYMTATNVRPLKPGEEL